MQDVNPGLGLLIKETAKAVLQILRGAAMTLVDVYLQGFYYIDSIGLYICYTDNIQLLQCQKSTCFS
jgi:hypothetical protein